MSFIAAFFIFLFGLLASLTSTNFGQAQSKASDVERTNDINAIYQKLEEFYNDNGYYPTDWDFGANDVDYITQLLPGIDQEALIDPQGLKIGTPGSNYAYQGQNCEFQQNSPIGFCVSYSLSSKLDDGTDYTKLSLN